MDVAMFVHDVASGVLSTVIATLIISGIAWLVWPFRWRLQGRAIQRMIANQRRFKFVYNPDAKAHKEMTFIESGEIGEGRNDNEYTWRIRRGALEIFASDGKLYSRFRRDRTNGFLKHTNDPELRSIPGQYLEPRLVKVSRAAT